MSQHFPGSRIECVVMDIAADRLRLVLRESEPRVTPTGSPDVDRIWADAAAELLGLVRAMGVPADRAPDVLQEVYLALVEKEPRFGGDGVRRWLFRVTINRSRLEHRQRGRWRRLFDKLAAWSSPPAAEACSLEQQELSAEVDAALGRLKEVEREAVVLRYFCGLNSREIGEVLELPEATVRSHLLKARQYLAKELAEWNED
jgi:RNA polymerase sigma-70 factor, ECF subfamily